MHELKEKRKLYIIGIGATADEIRQFVEKYDMYDIAGFAVNQQYISDNQFHGYPVYAIENLHEIVNKEDDLLFVALFWNHLNEDRKKLYVGLKQQGYRFATLISPSADTYGSQVGENCWIADRVYIKPDTSIGDNTFINACAVVEINTHIGNHCFIATGAVVGGSCSVGDQCFVGLNSTIFDHTTVGHHCIVGAATAVKRNVNDCSVIKTDVSATLIREYAPEIILDKLIVKKNVR